MYLKEIFETVFSGTIRIFRQIPGVLLVMELYSYAKYQEEHKNYAVGNVSLIVEFKNSMKCKSAGNSLKSIFLI